MEAAPEALCPVSILVSSGGTAAGNLTVQSLSLLSSPLALLVFHFCLSESGDVCLLESVGIIDLE